MNNYAWCLEYLNMLFGAALTPYDPDFERTMEIGRSLMRRYRNAMRELARH